VRGLVLSIVARVATFNFSSRGIWGAKSLKEIFLPLLSALLGIYCSYNLLHKSLFPLMFAQRHSRLASLVWDGLACAEQILILIS